MPTFDVVSEVQSNEVTNAVDQANRELKTRFDFRGIEAGFEWRDGQIHLSAEAEFQLEQMMDILRGKLVKRGIDPNVMDIQDVEHSGKTYHQNVVIREGIDGDLARQIVKLVKDQKMKVQVAIQGDQVRVTGKKRDDLQQVITLLKGADLKVPLQFNNFRD
ncbi:MAG: YajQ family cyclic di-GMP-binding protein [Proteobacteria bacterium]|jgi:cyclic-di-GMP-binding protein|nr:YajQ family cyclic di-GMP-binding protein [Pseudomonadota bacterium]MDA1300580.1 YajQ family cyclic di-GMP-binding protein [Pseudomonadota bacterium]